MLVVLFASLLVGCKCLQPFNETSINWFAHFNYDVSKKLPTFLPQEDFLSFDVKRDGDLKLAFRPTMGGYFRYNIEYAHLVSITLEFHEEEHPQIHILLRAIHESKEWTITSQVFGSPNTAADWARAKFEGVLLNSLNPDFATKLIQQEGALKTREAEFKMDWVEKLLRNRMQPRRIREREGRGRYMFYEYAGLPLIIVPDIFQKLNKVRTDMVIDREDDD